MVFRALSSPHPTHHLLLPTFHTRAPGVICALSMRLAHDVAADLVWKMRGMRKAALANTADKAKLARAVETSVRDFVHVATSNQKTQLDAMDAVNLIMLCRQGSKPFLVAKIWPLVQTIPLLPAHDERTSTALIGSAVSAALEARDSATAALVCDYVRATRGLVLSPATAMQLLSALRGKPGKVVEVISTLQQGSLGVSAKPQHYAVALQALVDAPSEAHHVFEMACTHGMVCWCVRVLVCSCVRVFA
jgi:hypothetical protein